MWFTQAVSFCPVMWASCDVQCSDEAILIKHLRPHIKDGLRIVCPIKGCYRKYNILSSFSCHMNRDHKSRSFSDVKAVQKAETQTDMQAVHTTVSHSYSTAIDNEEDSELNLQKPSEFTEIVNKNVCGKSCVILCTVVYKKSGS